MKKILLFILLTTASSVASAQQTDTTGVKQPETFEMQWKDSTITMQKYFVVFLKSGPKRSQTKEEAQQIQQQHMQYLEQMAVQGKTSITGPMGDDGDIRGIVIYNTATADEAKRLAEQDPAVKAERLTVEVHPWWAAKGASLK